MASNNPFAGPVYDFSPLSDIGDSIAGAIGTVRERRQIEDAWSKAGGDYNAAVKNLMAAGHTSAAAKVAKIQQATQGINGVYGTPVYGTTPDGREGVGAIGKDGQFHLLDTHGFNVKRGYSSEDLGYGVGGFNKGTGRVEGPVTPKTGDLPPAYVPPPNYNPWASAPANGIAPPQNPNELPVGGPESPLAPKTGPSAGVPGVSPLPATGTYMPGSEAAIKAQNAAEGLAEKEQQKKTSADIVTGDIARARQKLNSWTTGWGGALFENVPMTEAHDLQQILVGIKGNLGFDRLQQMRNASPTGAALGPVSDFENNLLQSVYGSLAQSQNKGQLDYNLRRLNNIYQAIINKGLKPGDPIPTGAEEGPTQSNVVDWGDL